MKISRPVIIALSAAIILLSTIGVRAQVEDIGINLKERGYIGQMNYAGKYATINFVLEKESKIQAQKILLKNAVVVLAGKQYGTNLQLLKAGMEVLVEGETFQEKDSGVAKVITVIEPRPAKSFEGRIDAVSGDYAIIDGNKVKLQPGGKIMGTKGYKGRSFNSFQELKLGDNARAEGTYTDGLYLASKLEIDPNTETESDKKIKLSVDELHQAYYPQWSDPQQQQTLYGSEIPGIGRITASPTMQQYVTKVAMGLVPAYIQKRIRFMFIVVDNPQFNAWVMPNGFSCVYTGLLARMENEAQLAAVLGHEIAHVLYEHSAKRMENKERVVKNSGFRKLAKATFGSVSTIVNTQLQPGKTGLLSNILNKADTGAGAIKLLLGDLPDVLAMKSLSTYSVENESQADRIGLYLMVKAGYDPREAAIVWKNTYNLSAVAKTGGSAAEQINGILGEAADDTGTASLQSLGKNMLNHTLDKWMKSMVKNSTKSHPDNIVRFEALNHLVSRYWSDEVLLSTARTGEDTWAKTVVAAAPELEKDSWENQYATLGDDYEKRVLLLNFAIEKGYTPSAYYYRNRGSCYLLLGKYKEAVDDYNKLISLNPRDTAALYLRGLLKNELGKTTDAIADFTKAISIDAANESYYYQRGYSYYHLNKFKEAGADFTKAIDLNTNIAKYYFARGNSSYKLLKYAAALADYQKTVALDPENEAATNNIAVCKAALTNRKSGTIQLVIVQ